MIIRILHRMERLLQGKKFYLISMKNMPEQFWFNEKMKEWLENSQ